jgi:hypothetical protein
VRELEEKRINKEMANIRKKFKGQHGTLCRGRWGWLISCRIDGSLDGYQKKKYDMNAPAIEIPCSGFIKQICSQDHLHVHPGLQSRRWTHGSCEPHFEPKIQREADCTYTPSRLVTSNRFSIPSSQHAIARGTRLTCENFYIQGIPGGDVVDARELRSA